MAYAKQDLVSTITGAVEDNLKETLTEAALHTRARIQKWRLITLAIWLVIAVVGISYLRNAAIGENEANHDAVVALAIAASGLMYVLWIQLLKLTPLLRPLTTQQIKVILHQNDIRYVHLKEVKCCANHPLEDLNYFIAVLPIYIAVLVYGWNL